VGRRVARSLAVPARPVSMIFYYNILIIVTYIQTSLAVYRLPMDFVDVLLIYCDASKHALFV
jgi:hypothetical protein